MANTVEIRPLARDDERNGFSCGQPDIDRFFQHYAGQNHFKLHLAVSYVALIGERVLGSLPLRLRRSSVVLFRTLVSFNECCDADGQREDTLISTLVLHVTEGLLNFVW